MAVQPTNRIFRLHVDPKTPRRAVASIDGASLPGLRAVEISAGGDALPVVRLELVVTEVDLQVPDPVLESFATQRRCEFCRGLVVATDHATREHVKICARHPMRAVERALAETEQLLGDVKRREEVGKNECGRLSKRIVDLEADLAVLTMHAIATSDGAGDDEGEDDGEDPDVYCLCNHRRKFHDGFGTCTGADGCPCAGFRPEPRCADCNCPESRHDAPAKNATTQARGACHATSFVSAGWDDGEGGCSCLRYQPDRVHVLREGLALCRFSLIPPGRWPEGHKWISAHPNSGDDQQRLNCEGCRTELRRAPAKVDDLTDDVREQLGGLAPKKVEVLHTDPGAVGKLTHFQLKITPDLSRPQLHAELPAIEVIDRDGTPLARVRPRESVDKSAIQLRPGEVVAVETLPSCSNCGHASHPSGACSSAGRDTGAVGRCNCLGPPPVPVTEGGFVVPAHLRSEVDDMLANPLPPPPPLKTVGPDDCPTCEHPWAEHRPYKDRSECREVVPHGQLGATSCACTERPPGCSACAHQSHGNSVCGFGSGGDSYGPCSCTGPAPIMF